MGISAYYFGYRQSSVDLLKRNLRHRCAISDDASVESLWIVAAALRPAAKAARRVWSKSSSLNGFA